MPFTLIKRLLTLENIWELLLSMKLIEAQWKERVGLALNQVAQKFHVSPPETGWEVLAEVPPKLELGDLAFPMFSFSKLFKMAPALIAKEVEAVLSTDFGTELASVQAAGPYVNLFFRRATLFAQVAKMITEQQDRYGSSSFLSQRRIMVEFSCPNTNKPLHLGHLRNNALGESISRILKFCAAEVYKVNLINDRGIHICKSMLSYQLEGRGLTPSQAGKKSDHFVGDWYVRYAQLAQQDSSLEQQAQDLLRRWESNEPEVIKLWELMNHWAISGIEQTYQRTGVSFDKVYKESETYLLGKKYVLEGLEQGIFFKRADGAIVARLPWKDNPKAEQNAEKVLLRSDGTSIYLTQDIGTALQRYLDWPFHSLIYVVANEQDYHFKVLFEVLRQLGHDWAKQLYHLSYGMVNLPEGRMKSREGTVVDADDLLDELAGSALEAIKAKEREAELSNPAEVAEKIALGALNYFLLQVSPTKDMVFNPQESLNFNGNTGPYLQYTGARLSALLRKAGELVDEEPLWTALMMNQEWELLRELERFPAVVEAACVRYDPSEVANYLYGLAQTFSRFYHDCPVLSQEGGLRAARLKLCQATLHVLKNGMSLLNIPFLSMM